MKKDGFTLSEVLVVIVIIGIISAIAIPSIILVNKSINERLRSEKENLIISAAKTYANDNPDLFNTMSEVKVYVYELLNRNYLEYDVETSDRGNCVTTINIDGDANTPNASGCMIDPTDNSSMNTRYVILRKEGVGISVTLDGEMTSDIGGNLVDEVCSRLLNGNFIGKDYNGNTCNCTNITNGEIDVCLITGNVNNNYLLYDGDMWRVMGIYDIEGTNSNLVAKMINDDNIDVE